MIKTLTNLFKQDKEQFIVPKSVQDCMPAYGISVDGILRLTKFKKNGMYKYSKTFKFTDINYAVASREDKEAMFLEYSELLNSFDSGAVTKITINNRKQQYGSGTDNPDPMKDDWTNTVKNIIKCCLTKPGDDAVQEKYVTISVNKRIWLKRVIILPVSVLTCRTFCTAWLPL